MDTCRNNFARLIVRIESLFRGRPDVGRRFLAENRFVGTQGLVVLRQILRVLVGTAFGGIVVQRTVEHFAAELCPVGAGKRQVQMPGFIDVDGRGDRVVRRYGEINEAFVLDDDAMREIEGPVVLPGESMRKRKGNSLPVNIEIQDCV